jgi:hypothetical protein
MEKLKQWLENPRSDFDSGFELLCIFMRNTYLLNNIKRKRDLAKLRHELGKELYRHGGVIVKIPHTHSIPSVKVPVRKIQPVVVNDVEKVAGPDIQLQGNITKDRVIIRREFPFLEDSDCPDEFKILVANMITAHTRYVKGHDHLYDIANKDNDVCLKGAADVVENYIENRMIWEELAYYRDNKKILGNHRIFYERKRREEILKLGFEDLKALRMNLQRRIVYRKKLISENRDDERVKEWMEEVARLEKEKKLADAPRKARGKASV